MKAKTVNVFLAKGFTYFSVLYLAGIHIPPFDSLGLTPSPIYFWTVIGVILYFMYKLYSSTSKNRIIYFFITFFILYLLMFQPLLKAKPNYFMHVIISYSFLLITYDLFKNMELNALIKIANNFINLTIIIVLIETLIRVRGLNLSEIFLVLVSGEFYPFKRESIIFGDSNSVAFLLITLILFLVYLRKLININFRFRLFIMVVLLILTYSRAAYLGLILLLVISLFRSFLFKISKQLLRLFDVFIIFILFFVDLVPFVFSDIINRYFPLAEDSSFQTKVLIPEKALNYLWNSDLISKLFGIGLGNSVEYINIASHNFVITYLFETGVIGLCFVLAILYFLNKISKSKFILFFYLIFIVGFSFVPVAMPYFFVSLILLYYIDKKLSLSAKK